MSATLLPNAEQQFVDSNGKPLAGGSVYFYIPNTSTFKATWQDSAQTTLNTNPVILDGGGRAVIWGVGVYRQVVYDQFGNLIWDKITEDSSGGILGNFQDVTFSSGSGFTPGVTTQLTLPFTPGSQDNLWVFFDGVYQGGDQYSLSGAVLTFGSPIPVGVQNVYVKSGTSVAIGVPANGSVGDAQIAWGTILERSVDSIAALGALNPATYKRAFVTGYYAAGDGGGGLYYYSPSTAQTSANGGTIIAAYGGTGCWLLSYGTSVSVLQFGAKADNGQTDNGVKFNAASAWCWQNNVALSIPSSRTNAVYGFTTAWTDAGWGTSGNSNKAITIISDPSAVLVAYASMNALVDFTSQYKFNCKIELGLLSGNTLVNTCITFCNIQDSIIDVMYATGFKQIGVIFSVPNSNPSNATIFNNRITLETVAGQSAPGVTGVLMQSPVSGIYGTQGNWLQVGQVIACARGIQIGQSGGDQTMYNTIVGGVVEINSINGIEDHSGNNLIGPIITDANTSNGIVIFAGAQPDVVNANLAADVFLDQTGKCVANIVNSTNAGQTYQDVSGARAIGTTYMNNTAKPILVLVSIVATSATPTAPQAHIGSASIEGTVVAGSSYVSQITFPVPPGVGYSVTLVGGGATLASWQELR